MKKLQDVVDFLRKLWLWFGVHCMAKGRSLYMHSVGASKS
jgi:hypothetical protein